MSTAAMDTSALTEAMGYAIEVVDGFWQVIPLDQRTKLITDLASRERAAKVSSEGTKAAVRELGLKVAEFNKAAAILVGYKLFEWVKMGWAGYR